MAMNGLSPRQRKVPQKGQAPQGHRKWRFQFFFVAKSPIGKRYNSSLLGMEEHRSLLVSHRSFTQDARENPIVGEVAKNLTEKSIAKERTAVDTGSATRVHARKGGDVKVERILNREIV